MVWCDDAAVGMLVPCGPAGGSWVLTTADHVVALVVVWGCCFGGPCNGVTFDFQLTTTAAQPVSICGVGWSLFFGGACLLVGVADIVARGTIMVQCCECEVGQHGGGV